MLVQLEEASTYNAAMTHAGNVFLCLVTLTFDLLTQKHRFPGLVVDHVYVKFGF